ncbi:hypothetical protein PESP_a0009 [Pseudoalteromonas espejiana DSM 9414]|uniref:Uncharacterized protein n=1 Tax=Pseudoalteromonas espejiana TaxID=28107 RepID=A0A510XYN7_9GAMM|nr:hypothetical protein PESP_a0009 [Pseudoalteromonas espejiana DSM 9414]GEK56039.1 hypothetical protein PES01_28840 [Pseudoalteromonas espejiana]
MAARVTEIKIRTLSTALSFILKNESISDLFLISKYLCKLKKIKAELELIKAKLADIEARKTTIATANKSNGAINIALYILVLKFLCANVEN